MPRVIDVFKIEWGNKAYHSKDHLAEMPGGVPLIASGDGKFTFGTHGFYAIPPRRIGVITIASTGSAGATYYRGYPCDVSDDALVLTPLSPMTEREMVWYQEALRAHRFKWSYGRKVTPDKLGSLPIQSPPAWLDQVAVPDFDRRKAALTPETTGSSSIHTADWHTFKLGQIFKLERGGGLTTYEANEAPGDIPFVGAAKTNNAVVAVTGAKAKVFARGKLALVKDGAGAVGLCFYQPKPFIASSHVMVLTPKNFTIGELSGVFMAHVISRLRPLFSYGRALTDDRVKNVTIRLPSSDGGKTPCTDQMEAIMSSLPFSGMFAERTVPVVPTEIVPEVILAKMPPMQIPSQLRLPEFEDTDSWMPPADHPIYDRRQSVRILEMAGALETPV